MDYQKMWKCLKEYVEMAIDEGEVCGYDKEGHEFFNAFLSYRRVLEEMNRQEGEQNESN